MTHRLSRTIPVMPTPTASAPPAQPHPRHGCPLGIPQERCWHAVEHREVERGSDLQLNQDPAMVAGAPILWVIWCPSAQVLANLGGCKQSPIGEYLSQAGFLQMIE